MSPPAVCNTKAPLASTQILWAPFKGQLDKIRVGTRSYHKVVFKLPLGSIKDQIHSRVQTSILHSCKVWHARSPPAHILTYEVIAFARQFIESFYERPGGGANHPHAYSGHPNIRPRFF